MCSLAGAIKGMRRCYFCLKLSCVHGDSPFISKLLPCMNHVKCVELILMKWMLLMHKLGLNGLPLHFGSESLSNVCKVNIPLYFFNLGKIMSRLNKGMYFPSISSMLAAEITLYESKYWIDKLALF